MDHELRREVLITGASGGIGGGIGDVFRAAGWRTIGVDLVTPPAAEQWDEFHQLDLAEPEAIAALFAALDDDGADTRCVVNNAGVQVCLAVQETPVAEWDRTMAVNLRAPYLMIRHGLPWLRLAAHASVINISSVHAVATSPSIGAYAASKGGLSALTRAAALDLASEGIRVNAVLPGAVDTPMLRAGLTRQSNDEPSAEFSRFASAQVVGRVGTPCEIGEVVLMLAAPETGGFFTGAAVVIDGGATIRLSTE